MYPSSGTTVLLLTLNGKKINVWLKNYPNYPTLAVIGPEVSKVSDLSNKNFCLKLVLSLGSASVTPGMSARSLLQPKLSLCARHNSKTPGWFWLSAVFTTLLHLAVRSIFFLAKNTFKSSTFCPFTLTVSFVVVCCCCFPPSDQEKVVNPSNLVASRILGWQ